MHLGGMHWKLVVFLMDIGTCLSKLLWNKVEYFCNSRKKIGTITCGKNLVLFLSLLILGLINFGNLSLSASWKDKKKMDAMM